jgi:hypothetical protein
VFTEATELATVYRDPEMSNCFLVAGPHGELVRLVPSRPPMGTYVTAHFLEGDRPTVFEGVSHTGVCIGVPWGTKDEIVALLRAEWAHQRAKILRLARCFAQGQGCGSQ